jgi:hypothetical protein
LRGGFIVNAVESLLPTEAHKASLSELSFSPLLVKKALQEHEESQNKTKHLGERKLGPGLKIFLWGLRLYVVFMVVVVVINVSRSIH